MYVHVVRAVELFSGLSCEQLLECVTATEHRPHLRQALLFCLDLRPLHLVGKCNVYCIKGIHACTCSYVCIHVHVYPYITLPLDPSPLDQPGCHDNQTVQALLPLLPFSTIVLQSIQLEPSLEASPPVPLTVTLSGLPQQLWRGSLLATGGGGGDTTAAAAAALLCAARTVLAVLLELCRTNHVCMDRCMRY